MPDGQPDPTRADLPDEFTPDTVRRLPVTLLRRLATRGNGLLDPEQQQAFDAALHQVMSEAADRVSRQIERSDWAAVRRELGRRTGRRGGPGRPSRVDEQLRRMTERIDRQLEAAETLAPGVDWSFAQPQEPPDDPQPAPMESGTRDTDDGTDEAGTVADLESRLTDQVELVQAMSEIADVGKRTYALEQQRDLQNTRSLFFGFVVSLAVIVAGWAPLVAADSWAERTWLVALTLATCVVAGVVYGLVRRWQEAHPHDDEG